MGFSADVQQILQAVSKTRQSLLFSATFSEAVKAAKPTLMLDKPQVVAVDKAELHRRHREATPSIRWNRSASASCSRLIGKAELAAGAGVCQHP